MFSIILGVLATLLTCICHEAETGLAPAENQLHPGFLHREGGIWEGVNGALACFAFLLLQMISSIDYGMGGF